MKKTVHGLDIELKHAPVLDEGFIPLSVLFDAYAKRTFEAGADVGLAVARGLECNACVIRVENPDEPTELDKYMALTMVKSMLWVYGGHRVVVAGSKALADYLAGLRENELEFDWDFMTMVYETAFEVSSVPFDELPQTMASARPPLTGRKAGGCRIGFDAGGSDIKVSAVMDGEAIFSEEIVWHPKITEDPEYHYRHIVDAMKLAASKLPRVDGIGVSSAGIYVDNKCMVASLFIKVPADLFDEKVKDIYIRAAAEIGAELTVANDGDVTALAGAVEYDAAGVLGIAMGTSEAGGYIDRKGSVTGWLNELAFVPVDGNPDAALDEWSGDIGRGVKYFSQDAVIKLAPAAGIVLEESLSPAEKLLAVQELMKQGDSRAAKIYESIGVYLGYSLAYYSWFYDMEHVLLLGRVMSGEGGGVILEKAKTVLRDEYPYLADTAELHLPDEKSRRVGQSVAAALL